MVCPWAVVCLVEEKAIRIAVPVLLSGILLSFAHSVQAGERAKTELLVLPRSAVSRSSPNKPGLPVFLIENAEKLDPETKVWIGLHARSITRKSDSTLWTKGIICKLTIASDGSIKSLLLQKSSCDKSKDQGALTLLRNAAPYYPLPSLIKEQTMLVEFLDYPRFKLTNCQ